MILLKVIVITLFYKILRRKEAPFYQPQIKKIKYVTQTEVLNNLILIFDVCRKTQHQNYDMGHSLQSSDSRLQRENDKL